MDTSYSIRLGIEDQAAVEKAFSAIGEAGKTALATVQGAAGTASNGLGAVSSGASDIAGVFDTVSASSTGLATALGMLGLPHVAAQLLALKETAENVSTALRTAGGAADVASSALSLLAGSQEEQAEAAQSATNDIAALAEAQAGLAEAQDEQAEAARTATGDIREVAEAQADLEEKSGTSLTTIMAWAAGIAVAAGVVYLAYKTVETGVELAGDALSALADIAGAEALRKVDEQAVETFRHQQDLARELGITAAALKAVAAAADELAVSQDQATGIARHLIEILDDQSGKSDLARATLKAYGVEIDGLTAKDWATVLDGWAAAMQGVADSAAKTKANLVVLGNDGTAALRGLSTAGSVTSAESERLATLTAELERRVSESLQRQAELAERPNWFERLIDSIDEAISRSEEFKLKQGLALEPLASGWAEYWADPGLSDLITLWDRLVESAGNYAALIGGEIGLGDGWEPTIATTTGTEAISPDLIAAIERLKEAYDPAIAESKKYRAEIDLVTEALRKLPAEAAGPLQELKEKIEAAYFAASADGKTMDWIQTLVDKARPAKTEADLLTEALEKLNGLLDGDLIDVKRYQDWGDALRGALDKAKQGAKDATAEFDRLKTSLTEQLYAIGKTQAEILRYRLENAKNDDGSAKYTPDQVNQLVGIQGSIDARHSADQAAQQVSRDTASYDRIIADLKASVTKLIDKRQAFIDSAVSRLPDSMKTDAAKVAAVKQVAAATWDEMQAIKDRTAAEEEATAAREAEEKAAQALAERRQEITDDIQQEIADNQSLMDALGKGSKAYDEQATYLNLLNQYRRAGIDLTAEEQEALRATAAQMTAATAKMAEMKSAQNELKTAGQEMGSALSDALKSVVIDGASLESALSSLASSITDIAWKILVTKQLESAFSSLGSSGFSLSSLFGFADGGVMTADGPLPLKRYATGGIANSPQLAVFGEGRNPEAYVPLPDGRSIPVTVASDGGSRRQRPVVINMSVNTPDASSFRRSEGQIGADIAARLRRAARRNG